MNGLGIAFAEVKERNWLKEARDLPLPVPTKPPEKSPSLTQPVTYKGQILHGEELRDRLRADAEIAEKKMHDIVGAIIDIADADLIAIGSGLNIHRNRYEQIDLKEVSRIDEKSVKIKNPKNLSDEEITSAIEELVELEKQGLPPQNRFYNHIKDYARGSTYLNHPHKIAALCAAYEWLKENPDHPLPHGAKVVDVDNKFEKLKSTHHRTIQGLIKLPIERENGEIVDFISETQIRHGGFDAWVEKKKLDGATPNNSKHDPSNVVYKRSRTLKNNLENGNINPNIKIEDAFNASFKITGKLQKIHDDAAQKFQLNNIPFDNFRALRNYFGGMGGMDRNPIPISNPAFFKAKQSESSLQLEI